MVESSIASQAASSSQKIEDILQTISDGGLREDVAKVVRLAFEALGNLRRIHLPQDHFEEGGNDRAADDAHLELAPYVLAAVSTINQLLGFISKAFPAPASAAEQSDDDFDLEFDLVDGPTGDGVGLSSTRQQEESSWTPREQVADALNAFGGMLRSRVLDLSERLKFARNQKDSWPLLNELDEAQHRLTKAVQAVLFGALGAFTTDARREEILPAYRSAAAEAVALRAAVAELTFHIGRLNVALADATVEIAVPLVVAVADRLARFSARPEYRTLRAEDKKAVIDFRRTLHDLRHRREGLPLVPLRHAVEGFSKFLEAMGAINHREVLILHDKQRLQDILAEINGVLSAGALADHVVTSYLDALVGRLQVVVGRNPEVDQARREYLARTTSPKEPIGLLHQWRGLVEMTLMTVG
ncbi:MAG: hypothetical protein A2341_23610 [Deltaproteobacteria bacterium RIFOXYB12_FULL_58_9]|nr:MAG: hypothetical protein A2341_23610 [Deltaproteobacteria bacterium RIFOXYB12_FULL_58_9]